MSNKGQLNCEITLLCLQNNRGEVLKGNVYPCTLYEQIFAAFC